MQRVVNESREVQGSIEKSGKSGGVMVDAAGVYTGLSGRQEGAAVLSRVAPASTALRNWPIPSRGPFEGFVCCRSLIETNALSAVNMGRPSLNV